MMNQKHTEAIKFQVKTSKSNVIPLLVSNYCYSIHFNSASEKISSGLKKPMIKKKNLNAKIKWGLSSNLRGEGAHCTVLKILLYLHKLSLRASVFFVFNICSPTCFQKAGLQNFKRYFAYFNHQSNYNVYVTSSN